MLPCMGKDYHTCPVSLSSSFLLLASSSSWSRGCSEESFDLLPYPLSPLPVHPVPQCGCRLALLSGPLPSPSFQVQEFLLGWWQSLLAGSLAISPLPHPPLPARLLFLEPSAGLPSYSVISCCVLTLPSPWLFMPCPTSRVEPVKARISLESCRLWLHPCKSSVTSLSYFFGGIYS